ncbi:MAG TPA: hypothetical protein VGF25_15230 [Thermoleophilaceae bacterium]
MTTPTVTIRRASAADASSIHDLAALDSASPPTGTLLLGEVGDELWAAVEVETGAAIADPFRLSADVVALLRLRAERITKGERTSRRSRFHLLPRAA